MESWKKRLDEDGEERKKLRGLIANEDKNDEETNVFLNNACNLCNMMLHESNVFREASEYGEEVSMFFKDKQDVRKASPTKCDETDKSFEKIEKKLKLCSGFVVDAEKRINEW